MTQTRTHKVERLEARLTPQQKERLSEAAALRGQKLSDFVLEVAMREAEQVVETQTLLRLSRTDALRVFELLENPPEPNAALLSAFARVSEMNIQDVS